MPGYLVGEPVARRAIPQHQHLVRHAAVREFVHGRGKFGQALFHHHAAEESDGDLAILDAEATPQREVAHARIEDRPFDPARPDADALVHPLPPQHLDHAVGGRHQRIAAAIELAQPGFDHRLHEAETIILRIGLEAGVDARQHRHAVVARPLRALPRGAIGAGDMDDIRAEVLEPAPRFAGQAERYAVFVAPRNGEGGQGDDLARLVDLGIGDRRGENPHLGAFVQQMLHQPAERLRGPVAHHVVIAAD